MKIQKKGKVMPKAYIMHGFIGSGKTTVAKRLEKTTGAKRFTPDEIISERYGRNLTNADEIREANIKVKTEIWEEVKTLISEGRDVILDYGLWKKEPRDKVINDVRSLGATPIVYEVLCENNIMRERALSRDDDGNNKITPELYDSYYSRLEPMDYNEEKITVCKSPMEKKTNQLAFIGGHLLCDKIEGAIIKRYYDFTTPFGEMSAPIIEAELAGKTFFYLKRHGDNHEFLPHEVNYRANIYALKMLGVTRVIGVSTASIESLNNDLSVGQMFIPDQYFDWAKNKKDTFFGNGLIAHISITNPCCPSLKKEICIAAKKANVDIITNKVLAGIKGPRFLTRSENNFLKSAGCDAVGMSCIPEVFLAREAQMSYSTIACVSDVANNRGTEDSQRKLECSEAIYDFNIWKNNLEKTISVIKEVIIGEPIEAPNYVRKSLLNLIKTFEENISENNREILNILKE